MATVITAKAMSSTAFVPQESSGATNAAPASPGAAYVQAEAVAVRDMVVDLRQVLINAGLCT